MSSAAKSKNFRRRGDGGDEDDVNDSNSNTAPRKAPSTSSKPKKLLSFADDEDGEDTEPWHVSAKSSSHKSKQKGGISSSKSSSSHRLTLSKDRLPAAANSSRSTLRPQAGSYTKEALLELQKNTRTLARSSASSNKPQAEPKIILKGLLKPPSSDDPPLPQTPNIPHQHTNDDHDDNDNEEDDHNDAQNRLSSLGLGKSHIPDEETIRKIRAKRERLRQSRIAPPDCISLDDGPASNVSTADGFSDDEPEFRTRIPMIGSAKHPGVFVQDGDDFNNQTNHDNAVVDVAAAVKANPSVAAARDDDEDEEDKIWEEEQFRKALGGNKRRDDASAASATNVTAMPKHHQPLTMYNTAAPSIIGGASQPLDALSIPQQAILATKALHQTFARLKESHSRTASSLVKTEENLSASLMNISALEKSLLAAGEKFIFMQKLRDFVSVICEFLQHKAPYIEELEAQMQTLQEQRASAISERRKYDDEDEMTEMETATEAARQVLSERGSSGAALTAATSAAQDATAANKLINLPQKLDELGRDLNRQKRMDMERRAKARQHRRDQFELKRTSSMKIDCSDQKIEGELSTDESDSESEAYMSNRDSLLKIADQIFSDASEEYSQLSMVKERFEKWKKEYSTSYRDAYMSLSAPAIFSPYVRLELLKWNPLHEDSDFFNMQWHSLLSDYGMPEEGSDPSPEDADANLVPILVEKIAVPILHHAITLCWDMLSTKETKYAVSAMNLVTDYVPPSSESLKELLVAIHTRLAAAVANIKVPTWSPLELKVVPSASRVAAYRFGMSVRLMRNICLWKDILSLPVLEKLAVDELLCGKVLPHIHSIANNIHDAITRTERIIASLSGVWAAPSAINDRSQKLQPLVSCVMSLGKRLKDKHSSGLTEIEVSGLARRLKKMLVELNDYDKAREIARMFSIREAL